MARSDSLQSMPLRRAAIANSLVEISAAAASSHSPQLPATRRHVNAPTLANGAGKARRLEHLLKDFRRARLSGDAGKAFCGIERDQIYVRGESIKQGGEAFRLSGRIVDTRNQRPFEENAAARLREVQRHAAINSTNDQRRLTGTNAERSSSVAPCRLTAR